MLILNHVSKSYRKKEVLQRVSLSIPAGSCYGLVGPNGAGKSTLLKIIASVIQDYQGDINLRGKALIDKKNTTGYVPQEICLEGTLSAYSNLCFFGEMYGLKGKKLKTRAYEVLQDIGLADQGKKKVANFSGGMKRRLNIGCALMHQPQFIIMDEPTVGIDPQSRQYIFKMIRQLKKSGCTIIYATHYMEEVEQLCDEVAFIDQGKIVEHGKMNELLQKYAVPSVFIKANKPYPKKLETMGEWIDEQGSMLVKTENPQLVMKELLAFYQAHPEDLERLERVKPRLEDVFFSLTGSALRDGNPPVRTEHATLRKVTP